MAAGGDNTIIGMSGDDHLNGGPGSLPGGAGADRFDRGSGGTVSAAIARTF
jgi:Ca2+-binding RTX toxin-like protein